MRRMFAHRMRRQSRSEGLSADTKAFVDTKLRELGSERRKLVNRAEMLESVPYEPIDADAVVRDGMASLRDLPRLLESGNLEERKEFVRAFVGGVNVVPTEARLELQMKRVPAVGQLLPENSACRMVAGARYAPVQVELRPEKRFIVPRGTRRLAA